MVLIQDIQNAYSNQKRFIKSRPNATIRQYLKKLHSGHKFVEVISGIRRSGKSTLMQLITERYGTNIAYFNFEDARIFGFDISDFDKLDTIMGEGKDAYFFDEIQNVPAWEIFVRQLHDRGEKIFVTGSNASLLSKELGTRLTGRHLRHELFPFSYSEYLLHKKTSHTPKHFEGYLQKGGFPEFLNYENYEIHQTLLRDIVLRDIAIRYGIKNTKTLMDIVLFLVSNVGKECTFNSLKKAYSVGSATTVSDYLGWLEDSYLLFFLPRFSYSAKSISVNPRKVYAIDNGLAIANSLSFSADTGRMLENAVYIYLRQQNTTMYYFKEKGECDFVLFHKDKCLMAIQVCEILHADNKVRELNGLMEAMEFFNLNTGYILTKNQTDHLTINGKTIQIIPAGEYMLREWEEGNG